MAKEKNHTSINGMSPVTEDSEGTAVASPNVCLTPVPSGQVPVPYPSIARSEDLVDGSKSVTINGASVCLSSSRLSRSTGDEAGTGGGVASGKRGGPALPLSYSFDVRIEGKPVVRNLDLFMSNGYNTPPAPILQPQQAPPLPVRAAKVEVPQQPVERCPYCGKTKHAFDTKGRWGGNLGSSAMLGRNMLEGRELSTHPWHAGPFSLAAHHLICLEALDEPDWAEYCKRFGYHPDRKQNGVFLPMKMAIACQLHVAVHRGNHAEGHAFDLHLPYPDAVKRKLKDVAAQVERGAFCDNPDALVQKLDKLSAEILAKVSHFTWTLTRDGLDYQEGGVGCAGARSISDKPHQQCPQGRHHDVAHSTTALPLRPRPLEIGE